MKTLVYRIKLIEPVLLTSPDGDENSVVSFDYLPGSVLRGALIAKYLRQHNKSELDAHDSVVRRLFFNGGTRFLNGYLYDKEWEQRLLPVPLSWKYPKGETGKAYDFAIYEPVESDDRAWKQLRAGYISLALPVEREGEVPVLTRRAARRQLAIHTARNRRLGRAQSLQQLEPGENAGAIYRYNTLAAGQSFAAAIVADIDEDLQQLRDLLAGELLLGGSRTGGYGRALVTQVDEEDQWQEAGQFVQRNDNLLYITLASDALLRDSNGQYAVSVEVVQDALSHQLGVPAAALTPVYTRCFISETMASGFNRKWNLPLPQTFAIQKGSVLVFRVPDISKDFTEKLMALQHQGIGDRRAEGFGRLLINIHQQRIIDLVEPAFEPDGDDIPGFSKSAERLAKRMVERLFRQRLDELVLGEANTAVIHTAAIRPSQLSRLRNLIQRELTSSLRIQEVASYLDRLRSKARKQFEQASIGDRSLFDWIKDKAAGIEADNFALSIADTDRRKIGSVEPELTPELRAEYTLRLMDAVLARAAKEAQSRSN